MSGVRHMTAKLPLSKQRVTQEKALALLVNSSGASEHDCEHDWSGIYGTTRLKLQRLN